MKKLVSTLAGKKHRLSDNKTLTTRINARMVAIGSSSTTSRKDLCSCGLTGSRA